MSGPAGAQVERSPSRRSLFVTTGTAGLATVVLIFGGQGLVQVGGGEPVFDATAAVIADYFADRHQTLFALGTYLNVLAAVVFLWSAESTR